MLENEKLLGKLYEHFEFGHQIQYRRLDLMILEVFSDLSDSMSFPKTPADAEGLPFLLNFCISSAGGARGASPPPARLDRSSGAFTPRLLRVGTFPWVTCEF